MDLKGLYKLSFSLIIVLAGTLSVVGQQETIQLLTTVSETTRSGKNVQHVMDYLASELNVYIENTRAENIRQFVDELKSDQYDLVYISPFYYSLAKNRGVEIEPLVAYAYEDGNPLEYYSCIIASQSSGINNLNDLTAKENNFSFKFSKSTSTAGHMIPRLQLATEGIRLPELFFANVGFSGTHGELIAEVANGSLDAGSCACSKDDLTNDKIKGIWTSPPIIRDFFASTKSMNVELKEKIKQTLVSMHEEARPEIYQKIINSHKTEDFRRFVSITEEPIEFMLRSIDDVKDIHFFLSYYQDHISQQQEAIIAGDQRLKEQQELLENQQASLKDQIVMIENQSKLLYISLIAIFLTLVAVIVFYRNFKQRKSLSERLEKKAKEFEVQNSELKELSKSKEGLTQMIAHDMKTPLNVVLGLSEKIPDEEKTKEIHQCGKLMQQMVTNMLDIQKYEQKKMFVNFQSVNVKRLVNLSIQYMEFLLNARDIHFSEEIDDDVFVLADSDIFMRVLTNLFSNAVKYNPAGSSLSVQVERIGKRVKVIISDTGEGIHPDDLPFIFDKFWQVDSKKSGRIQSTGLGLTFCKMAMEAHGQTIEATSKVGVGTTFTLYFESAPRDKNVQPAKMKKKVEKNHDTISSNDLQQIDELIERIKNIPLYKYTTITNELRKDLSTPRVEEWKAKVIAAAGNWNQDQYMSLLSFTTSEKSKSANYEQV
ncbi:MAG: PhnD/SsuA/transferrin family substrate-binding protein [Bacteroidota bacterium]